MKNMMGEGLVDGWTNKLALLLTVVADRSACIAEILRTGRGANTRAMFPAVGYVLNKLNVRVVSGCARVGSALHLG